MAETQTGVRVELADVGEAAVATGLPVLDHLLGELARTARVRLSLEVAPGSADAEVAAAGNAIGSAFARLVHADGAAGAGWAFLPSEEALAAASLDLSDAPMCASNVDFSHQRVGGLASDVVTSFLNELASAAGLNVHIRLLEGRDPEHVLVAIFKALGAALGQASRPPTGGGER